MPTYTPTPQNRRQLSTKLNESGRNLAPNPRSVGMKRAHARPEMRARWAKAREKGRAKRRARLDPEILLMHADYTAGMSLAGVGRKYGRHRGSVRELFAKRGLAIRVPAMIIPPKYANGQIIPMKPATDAELKAMIASATKLAVPAELRLEWRKWSMERRGEFIARLRAKLHSPLDGPGTPFSANVEPFDYASPRAHKISDALSREGDTRSGRIRTSSQGVIWRDALWFWSPKAGYARMGAWTPDGGRPILHRVMWEFANKRKLRPGDVVRFIDGNWNNLVPENFKLITQNDVARENQAKGLTRKSRLMTELLLKKTQEKKGVTHAGHEIVTAIHSTKSTAR
jgi:hypothetical protein